MRHQKITVCILALLVTVFTAGCSRNIKVLGTVVFADDQSPLTVGTVLLQSDVYSAKGNIDETGSFSISSIGQNDGIPPGVYRVAVIGAISIPEPPTSSNTVEDAMTAAGRLKNFVAMPKPLIDAKYANPQISGIVFDTSKDSELHIVVERAPK